MESNGDSGIDTSKMGHSADLEHAVQYGLQLCDRNRELESELAEAKRAERRLRDENEEANQRVFDAEEQLRRKASVAAHLEDMERLMVALEADKRSLASNLTDCERRLLCTDNKTARLELEHAAALDLRDKEIDKLTGELRAERDRGRSELRQASAAGDASFDMRAELDALAAQRDELLAAVDAQRQALADTAHRLAGATHELDECRSRFDDADRLYRETRGQLEEEQERTLELQVQLRQTESRHEPAAAQKGNSVFAELDEQRTRAEHLVKKFERELDECVGEKRALQNEVARLKTHNCILRAQAYESASAADGAVSRAADSQLADARRDIESLREKLRLAERRAHDAAVAVAAQRASSIGVPALTAGGMGPQSSRGPNDAVLRAELAQTKQECSALRSEMAQARTRLACSERDTAELRAQLAQQRRRADAADARCRELGAQQQADAKETKENERRARRQRRVEQIVVLDGGGGGARPAAPGDLASGVSGLLACTTTSSSTTLHSEASGDTKAELADSTLTACADRSPLKPANRRAVALCDQVQVIDAHGSSSNEPLNKSGSGERPSRRQTAGRTVDVAACNAKLERPPECNQQ